MWFAIGCSWAYHWSMVIRIECRAVFVRGSPMHKVCDPPKWFKKCLGDMVLFAGNTVWSISERVRGVCVDALYRSMFTLLHFGGSLCPPLLAWKHFDIVHWARSKLWTLSWLNLTNTCLIKCWQLRSAWKLISLCVLPVLDCYYCETVDNEYIISIVIFFIVRAACAMVVIGHSHYCFTILGDFIKK